MNPEVLGNIIGLIAGTILLVSGLPVLWEQLKSRCPATDGERRSRLLMAGGNAVWVVAGLMTGFYAAVVMCGINVVIQMAIFVRMLPCGRK